MLRGTREKQLALNAAGRGGAGTGWQGLTKKGCVWTRPQGVSQISPGRGRQERAVKARGAVGGKARRQEGLRHIWGQEEPIQGRVRKWGWPRGWAAWAGPHRGLEPSSHLEPAPRAHGGAPSSYINLVGGFQAHPQPEGEAPADRPFPYIMGHSLLCLHQGPVPWRS